VNGKRGAKPGKNAKLMESQPLRAHVPGATFSNGVFDTGERAILTSLRKASIRWQSEYFQGLRASKCKAVSWLPKFKTIFLFLAL
jgi:hypothetical protein